MAPKDKDTRYLRSGKNPAEPFCPSCGKPNNGYTQVSTDDDPSGPQAGNVSLCAYCGVLCVFEDGGGLRFPTVEEAAEIMQDPLIRKLVAGSPIVRRYGP